MGDVELSNVKLLGNLHLNLWDCGGQDAFMENYFTSQSDNIFRNVEVLIYVFDVESREPEGDLHYYQKCLDAILKYSSNAKIFCLIHKMDLIAGDQREIIFNAKAQQLEKQTKPLSCSCFSTSIWDNTLYRAWSSIVHMLIPNVVDIEQGLADFAEINGSSEVLLFERNTFLVIAHAERRPHKDENRFEKISNIIKQFKRGVSKLATQFTYIEVRNKNFSAFMDHFTPHTVICVVQEGPNPFPTGMMAINLKNAKDHFIKLEQESALEHLPATHSAGDTEQVSQL